MYLYYLPLFNTLLICLKSIKRDILKTFHPNSVRTITFEGKKAILIGGGIGIPPMLELSKQLGIEKSIVLGYRDQETFLSKEFEEYGNVYIATEDGSVGTKGNVIDAINAKLSQKSHPQWH